MAIGEADFAFDVALSFAGEDREYVDRVAERLRARGVRVFYDRYAVVDTWGVDLYELFDEVFRAKARFAVVFVSKNYVDKPWPTHERRSAQARALTELGPYLLPVRLDDAELPGLRPTVGYVDARQLSPESLTDLICQKIASGNGAGAPPRHATPPPRPPDPLYQPASPYPPLSPHPSYPSYAGWPAAAWPATLGSTRRTLGGGMRRSWKVIFSVAVASVIPGTIFATYSFQASPDSFPAGTAFAFMLRLALVMGTAAVLVSWLYDVATRKQGFDDFALLDWPWWHRIAVGAAAILAPASVVLLHKSAIEAAEARVPRGEVSFYPWGTSTPYGPPLYFWWVAPVAMLAVHVLCLAIRYVRLTRRAAPGNASSGA